MFDFAAHGGLPMFSQHTLRTALVATVLLVGSGCSLPMPRPVTFHVQDGDTGEAIADAEVAVDHWVIDFGRPFATVGPRSGVTDRNGNVTLVVDPRFPGFNCSASAANYNSFPADTPGIVKADSFQSSHPAPGPWYSPRGEHQLRLFRGPRPTADVTIPDGYRGVVVVNLQGCDQPPPPLRGRRAFTYAASPRGVVDVPEGALFAGAGLGSCIRVRYQNGRQLLSDPNIGAEKGPLPDDSATALRCIGPDKKGATWLFVVGTTAEATAVSKEVWPARGGFDEAAFQRIVDQRR